MGFNSAFKGLSTQLHTRYHGRIRLCGGLKFIQFLGPSLRKRIQNYEYEITYESEYLFRMRNHNKLHTLNKRHYHIHHKIQNNNIFTNCLTHLYNTFFPYIFWMPYSFDRLFV